MKKLKKDVYINLRGKSKEELTELWEFLESVGEKQFRETINDFLINCYGWIAYEFTDDFWELSNHEKSLNEKTEVTIQQLKEILQPMEGKGKQLIKEAKERGFLTEGNQFYSCFDDENKIRLIKPYNNDSELNLYLDNNGYLRYDDGLNNKYNESLCSNPAIYKDGVWAEIKNNNLTIEQQLKKAKAEVERLEKAIEENEIKVGDFVLRVEKEEIFRACKNTRLDYINGLKDMYRKITDKDLINKLNELIK